MPVVDRTPPGKPGSILFGTFKKPATLPGRAFDLKLHSNLGYFAFPPGIDPAAYAFKNDTLNEEAVDAAAERANEREKDRQQLEEEELAWKAEQEYMMNLRQQRLAGESKEARRGEEYWVSCGGVLRDEEGRRDLVRTQAIREELLLRVVENWLIDRWEKYEKGWAELVVKLKAGGNGKEVEGISHSVYIRFEDIPWPVEKNPSEGLAVELQDLSFERIEEFLLGGLKVRGCKVTRKERVRSSLLRWHPDKMTVIVSKVIPQDSKKVEQGINTVMSCLHRMNAKS